MNPQDLTVQRVLAMYISNLEVSNQQLQAQITERDKRIAELEAVKSAKPRRD